MAGSYPAGDLASLAPLPWAKLGLFCDIRKDLRKKMPSKGLQRCLEGLRMTIGRIVWEFFAVSWLADIARVYSYVKLHNLPVYCQSDKNRSSMIN